MADNAGKIATNGIGVGGAATAISLTGAQFTTLTTQLNATAVLTVTDTSLDAATLNAMDLKLTPNVTTVTGGTGADTITFAAGTANTATVIGGTGIDIINLGAGHSGSVNVQLAAAAADKDTISNFVAGGAGDSIELSKTTFTAVTSAIGAATLSVAGDFAAFANAAALATGAIATSTDANPLIFLQDTGSLYYNTNGATADGFVLIATGLPSTLAATDFAIIC